MPASTMSDTVQGVQCPVCGDYFKDARGLSGHLQFKHELKGKEHRKKLEEGKERGRRRQQKIREEAGDAVEKDPILRAAERLAKAQARRDALESTSGGYQWPRVTTWQEVKGEAMDRCEAAVEQAREELEELIQEEVDRRKSELDEDEMPLVYE